MAGSTRELWINNDPGFLVAVARELANERAARCLSVEDREAVSRVANGQDFWQDVERIAERRRHVAPAATATPAGEGSGGTVEVDDLTALFRARSLIYENSIESDLFKVPGDDDRGLVSSYTLARRAGEVLATSAAKTDKLAVTAAGRARADDDDDYDDEEDDEDEDEVAAKAPAPAPPVPVQPKAVAPRPLIPVPIRPSSAPLAAFSRPGSTKPFFSISRPQSAAPQPQQAPEEDVAAAENRRNEDSILAHELNTQYHTLDYDRHAMLEQHKLEASDRQVDLESDGNARFSNMNFGAANLSLKHLLAKIEASREKLAMTDNELRTLLSDVRKNRSKWANEDKIGQEELYEAAERVVLELRGYTEHSTAFLNKVTKRDVPDYYNIIKNPMDLGTLMKKLKNLEYKSKKEFADDVALIWQNCLTYNAAPEHPIRKHAFAMQRRSQQLLGMVPEITIRSRAEVEAEEFGAEPEDDAESEDEKPLVNKSTRGTVGSKSTKAKKAKGGGLNEPQMQPNGHADGPMIDDLDGDISMLDDTSEAKKTVPAEPETEDPQTDGNAGDQANDRDDDTSEETDFGFQLWRQRTNKSRALYTSERYKLFKGDTLKQDHTALAATSQSFVSIPPADAFESYKRLRDEAGEEDNDARSGSNSKNAQSAVNVKLCIREYEPEALPPVSELASDNVNETAPRALVLVDDLSRFAPPEEGLYGMMKQSSLEMKNIRHLCSKLDTLRLMQEPTMSAFPANYFRQRMEAESKLNYEPLRVEQEGYDCAPCGEELAHALLKRTSSQILYHSGFEDFQPRALEAFTDMAGEYLCNLGKVMKLYSETPTGTYTAEDVLLHSLNEGGMPEIAALDAYVKEEIVTKHDKVISLHQRFKEYLNDFINGTIDGQLDPNSMFDEENRDALVAGTFGDETGEDFFGFRELGLDKEFGLSSLSVPLRLLQGRLRPQSGIVADDPTTPIGLRFDRKFPPITRRYAAAQIGLFRPFLEAKLAQIEKKDILPAVTAPATAMGTPQIGAPPMSISASHNPSMDGTMDGNGFAPFAADGAPTPAATEGDKMGDDHDVPEYLQNGTTHQEGDIVEELVLVEDEDLPPRQRKPKPRLPPNGKIVSAQKRPLREPAAAQGTLTQTIVQSSPHKKRKRVEPDHSPAMTFTSAMA